MSGCEISGSGFRETNGIQDGLSATPLLWVQPVMICRARRFELKPNDAQRTRFAKCAGVARFAWNWALDERQHLYREGEGAASRVAEAGSERHRPARDRWVSFMER